MTNRREKTLGIKGKSKGKRGDEYGEVGLLDRNWGGRYERSRRGEERITRDERNRKERIIGGRDERPESNTASETEMGRERRRETDREVLESSGAGVRLI